MTTQELKNLFTPRVGNEEQTQIFHEVRKQALKLAGTMLVNSPGCPEQTLAIRKVHEALFYFNLAQTLEKPKALGAGR
jgi:hypothetical protein